ncbi:hypothetical protein [Bradyrhizobium sp. CCBAU 051011]|uniref:helix-turn-helix transcriptional regulator n=1 Tax=Bradyrhizobium sp. CCBAU 051011 TaxID=858422 RepID=UPI00192A5D4B|nr:hypothetical protein [Bradyrhizobium sp. CCBAU 051011]
MHVAANESHRRAQSLPLSHLPNGNAALSADMAARLEKAFKKFTRKELLDMQAEYDAAQASKRMRRPMPRLMCPVSDDQSQQH